MMKIELDEIMKVLEGGWKMYQSDPAGYQSYMKGFIDGWKNGKEESNDKTGMFEADEQLFLEPMTGRYFRSSFNKIQAAVNKVNRQIVKDLYASFNDWFIELGLDAIGFGELFCWNIERPLELEFIPMMTKDNRPYLMISYRYDPREGGLTNETQQD